MTPWALASSARRPRPIFPLARAGGSEFGGRMNPCLPRMAAMVLAMSVGAAAAAAEPAAPAAKAAKAPPVFQGKIERFDPAFDQLVAADAVIEKLAEGYTWSEGPVWHEGGVVFSDVPRNTAWKWTPIAGCWV